MLTTESLNATYEALAAATRAMHMAVGDEVLFQNTLNWDRWVMIANGTVTGKNEAEREANLHVKLEEEYTSVADAAEVVHGCRLALDLAQQRVDCLKLELRLRELEARTAGGVQ
jgi:hypothetical protein